MRLLLLCTLIVTTLFAESEFMRMCMHPTPSQKITLEAIAQENRIEFGVEACKIIEKYYINGKPGHNEDLYLPRLGLTDLSPIGSLVKVNSIDIDGNDVKDITPLAKLINLKQLNLSYNPIGDILPLQSLKKLESLTLYKYNLNHIDILSSLVNLKSLSISVSEGSTMRLDLKIFENMKSLETLYINNSPVDNVCALENLTNLKVLSLSNTEITNIDCLNRLTKLTNLTLQKNSIIDISVLTNYPKLHSLDISKTQVENVEALKPLKHLSVIVIDDTKITDLSPISGRNMDIFSAERTPLRWCSPKTGQDIIDGVSCYEKDGTPKSWWKRLLRQ